MNNKTQKERLDNGRELFNKVLLLNSKADTIYEAISEWECTYEIDCYNGNNFYIEDLLIDYGRVTSLFCSGALSAFCVVCLVNFKMKGELFFLHFFMLFYIIQYEKSA